MLVEVDPARWDDLVRGRGVSDVYYARGFVEASAVVADGAPVYLHLRGEDGDVVFPCLVREDPPDVVTPYGYGGPLAVGTRPPVASFADAYAAWCAGRGVVSTFAVHHPLFANQHDAPAFGFHVQPLAGTVAWPLGAPDLDAGMHAHHRRLLRRARAAGLVARAEPAPAALDDFAALYDAAMVRLGAAPFYRFAAPYWEALVRLVPLVLVEVRDAAGTLVAAVLGMGDPPWLHYHLGASSEAGRGTGASHLALATLAAWGREHGYDLLHLGGGVGGRADSLLEYKRRFAPDGLREAAIGKAVHDRAAYAALTGTRDVDWGGFFPAYRAPR